MTKPTEEALSAYVDGELSPEEQRAVEAHLAADAEARAYVDTLRQINLLVPDAFAELVPPPSQAMADRINAIGRDGATRQTASVVRFPRPGERRTRIPAFYAIAASIAVAVACASVYVALQPGGEARLLAKGPLDQGTAIADLLERGQSGQSANVASANAETSQVALAATFKSKSGRYCRELEVSPEGAVEVKSASIACRSPEGVWTIEGSVVVAAADVSAPSYVPSGSEDDEPLAPLLQMLELEKSMSPADEGAAIERRWR